MAAKQKQPQVHTVRGLLEGVERLFLQVIIGLAAPILGLLAGWWGSLPFVPEASIWRFALGGLLFGLLLDALFLRRWVRAAYSLPMPAFVSLYLFYSVCLFGFFMGVPLFNLLLGVIGGYYVGLCLRHQNKPEGEVATAARRTALFAALVLALVCAASWTLAYLDASLEANIQGMLALAAPISRAVILRASVLAGLALVAAEYFLTRAAVRFARFL
jgi:hypothetical protein